MEFSSDAPMGRNLGLAGHGGAIGAVALKRDRATEPAIQTHIDNASHRIRGLAARVQDAMISARDTANRLMGEAQAGPASGAIKEVVAAPGEIGQLNDAIEWLSRNVSNLEMEIQRLSEI